jgi:hypothetical protein
MSENIPPENIENVEENNSVEAEEPKQTTKKPISDEKRKQLEKARIKAQEKKKELKELNNKSKQLHIEEVKVKAIQYDQIIKQKEELLKPKEEPKPEIKEKKKRIIKKIIYEDDSEEEIEDKRHIQKQPQYHFNNDSYTNLVYQSACDKLKEKVQDERTKFLINSLMPNNYR